MARILVIDDTKNIRKMVGLTLEKEGHAVQAAEDGVQGLELFGDGTAWDLTLIDQRMPELEGREVAREVRRRDPAARLVMMTAFATIELASDVLRAGATDFLRKPFSSDVLRGAVMAALARSWRLWRAREKRRSSCSKARKQRRVVRSTVCRRVRLDCRRLVFI